MTYSNGGQTMHVVILLYPRLTQLVLTGPYDVLAPGVDRSVMLLAGEENLCEIVLFPMNQRAEDLLMGAPSTVTPKQLRELHIRLVLPEIKS
jgi:hypothetical protein